MDTEKKINELTKDYQRKRSSKFYVYAFTATLVLALALAIVIFVAFFF